MSLGRATASELTKLFTTAIWWILAIVLAVYLGLTAGGLSAAIGGTASGALPGSSPMELGFAGTSMLYSIASSIGYVFPALIGTLMVTGEFRHQTLTLTFLATPRRGTVLWGKILTGAVAGVLYGVIGVVVTGAAVAGILSAFGIDAGLADPATWAMFGRILIAYVLWVLVGIGIGLVVRNQVAAIVVVLAFTQFLEPLMRVGGAFVDWLNGITQILPGAASDALVGASMFNVLGDAPGSEPLEWWAGGAVLLGYALILLLIGHIVSWRRDVA